MTSSTPESEAMLRRSPLGSSMKYFSGLRDPSEKNPLFATCICPDWEWMIASPSCTKMSSTKPPVNISPATDTTIAPSVIAVRVLCRNRLRRASLNITPERAIARAEEHPRCSCAMLSTRDSNRQSSVVATASVKASDASGKESFTCPTYPWSIPGGAGIGMPIAETISARPEPAITPIRPPVMPRTAPSVRKRHRITRRFAPSAIIVPISDVRSRMLIMNVFEMLRTMIVAMMNFSTPTCFENSATVLL